MACLRTGAECGYTDRFVPFAATSTEIGARSEVPTKRWSQRVNKSDTSLPSDDGQATQRGYCLLDMTPRDSFAGLSMPGALLKLPAKSRWLLHTCKSSSLKFLAMGGTDMSNNSSCPAEHSRSFWCFRANGIFRVRTKPCQQECQGHDEYGKIGLISALTHMFS